jgi:hypothetical protein
LLTEYGPEPELTVSQKESIYLAAEYKARLKLKGDQLDEATLVMLGRALRREMAVLAGD